MISNEVRHGGGNSTAFPPRREFKPDKTLKTVEVQIEWKKITVSLRENDRGKFVRILEETGGRHNMVCIQATGLNDFKIALEALTAL